MRESTTVDCRAGVLDLLRAFKNDATFADKYAAEQLDKARSIEPVLKAFEYLPRDVNRKPGPFSGIPVAIKDIIATTDMPTTNGSPIYRDCVPNADAWVVERLRNLGATIFGKTVSTEFAWRHPGPTINPWNSNHTPGGSSSGSAAAVAAGIVPLSLGSQTLGSVIRPAAFNGIVGFKPSFGAIPRIGVHPLSPSLDHVGFFARRVDDVALALSLLNGTSDGDSHGRQVPGFDISIDGGLQPLAKPRLAVVRFEKWSRADLEQQKVFNATIATLRSAGALVEDHQFPDLDRTNWETINIILACEGALLFRELVESYPDRTSDHLKLLVRTGSGHGALDYLEAKSTQDKLRKAFTKEMSEFDAVVTLPAFGEAPKGLAYTGDAEYCAPWTLIGAPALSLPTGFGSHGLPLGLQIAGTIGADYKLLRVAKWVEGALAFDPGMPTVQA